MGCVCLSINATIANHVMFLPLWSLCPDVRVVLSTMDMSALFLSSWGSAPLPSAMKAVGFGRAVFDDEYQTLWSPQASTELLQLPMASSSLLGWPLIWGVSHAVELRTSSATLSSLSSWTVLGPGIKQEPSDSFHSTGIVTTMRCLEHTVYSHGILPWSSTTSCKLLWSLEWCSVCNTPQVGENTLERQGLRGMIHARTSAAFLLGAKLKRDVGTREGYEHNISTRCLQSTFWQQLGVKDHPLNICNLQAMLVTDVASSVTISKFKYRNFVTLTVLLKLEIHQQSKKKKK